MKRGGEGGKKKAWLSPSLHSLPDTAAINPGITKHSTVLTTQLSFKNKAHDFSLSTFLNFLQGKPKKR